MIWTIVIGIVAGAIAGKIMKHNNQGCLVDLLRGSGGGGVGGDVLGWLGVSWDGTIGQIGPAVVGAVLVLWIWAKIK